MNSSASLNTNIARHATPLCISIPAAAAMSLTSVSLLPGRHSSHPANIEAEKISNMVRSVNIGTERTAQTPTPTWDNQTVRQPSVDSGPRKPQSQSSTGGREPPPVRAPLRNSRETTLSDRYGTASRHARSDSEVTGVASSGGYAETTQSGPARRHDYDVQAMETTPGSPRAIIRNPIPAPIVTVRSEFPTVNRSRQQQTLTCLVTIEVPDKKWKPDPDDLGSSPTPQAASINARLDDTPARSASPTQSAPRLYPFESPEALEEMSESLHNRVDNWHGLDFNR